MVDNTKKMETENIVSVELSLINPLNIGFPVANKEELTSLNFDIHTLLQIFELFLYRLHVISYGSQIYFFLFLNEGYYPVHVFCNHL